MKIDAAKMDISDYLGTEFDCDCGRKHSSELKAVKIRSGALREVSVLMKKYGYLKAYLIADEITYKVAGEDLSRYLQKEGMDFVKHIFTTKRFIPDEKALAQVLISFELDCDVIIAIGAGSINDLCRYASFKLDKPYFIVATAPLMDGFASNVAALVVNDLKTTYVTHTPQVLIGDTDILSKAPLTMIAAGLGDTLGKYTSLCDWKLSSIINGEYYCPTIVEMVKTSIKKAHGEAEKILNSDPDAVSAIMEALVLTGIAMSFANDSRPAAGSEHHLSHYWETILMQEGLPYILHGTQVGIGTHIILKIAELMVQYPVDFSTARRSAYQYNQQSWEEEIQRVYGAASEGIIKLENESGKNETVKRLKRIDIIERNWQNICNILKTELISSKELISLLKRLNTPYLPAQKGITDEMLWNAIVYGKEIRNRYTILQMVWDLGLLKYMADRIVEYVNINTGK